MFLSRMTLVMALLAGSAAQAVTIDFEDIASPNDYLHYGNNTGLSSKGFNFKISNGFVIDSDFRRMRSYRSNNGTDWLMHSSTEAMIIDHGGSLFSMTSLDAGQYRRARTSSDIIVTGTQNDGTVLTQEISSKGQFETIEFVGWDDLVEVEFTGNRFTTYDNFVFTTEEPATVPIPGSLGLMVGALGGLGLFARRRKTRGC